MSTYERAKSVYLLEPCRRTFREDLEAHLKTGFVFSTPDVFVMGRPILQGAPYTLITDPTVRFEEPDTWLVYLMAGDLSEVFRYLPFHLDKIAFERDNKLRFYSTERLKKLCCTKSSLQNSRQMEFNRLPPRHLAHQFHLPFPLMQPVP